MYKIIKDTTTIGMTERPNYIRRLDNGSYTLCDEPEAQGVAYEGTPYHLWGRPEMDGVESVALVTVDAGTMMFERLGEIADKSDGISDLNFTIMGALADIGEMLIDLQMGGTFL